jgi:hypothetical protein
MSSATGLAPNFSAAASRSWKYSEPEREFGDSRLSVAPPALAESSSLCGPSSLDVVVVLVVVVVVVTRPLATGVSGRVSDDVERVSLAAIVPPLNRRLGGSGPR